MELAHPDHVFAPRRIGAEAALAGEAHRRRTVGTDGLRGQCDTIQKFSKMTEGTRELATSSGPSSANA